jgi:hypothetical protein
MYYKPENVGSKRKLCTGALVSRYPYFARRYPYFARLTSGTVALPVPTEEGISEEFEGCQDPVSPRTVAEVENSKLRTLVDLTELDKTGFNDDGI